MKFMNPRDALAVLAALISVLCVCAYCAAADEADDEPRIRVASYNVMFGQYGTPEQVAEALKAYRLDVIAFNEVPGGDWTERVGQSLGMAHAFIGEISSANHKDKYKSLLSRTPLRETVEIALPGDSRGWNPASAVCAVTTIHGREVAVYSLHICGWSGQPGEDGRLSSHSQSLADHLRLQERADHVIVMGDFNNYLGDPALNVIEEIGLRAFWRDLDIDLNSLDTGNALVPTEHWGVIDHIFYNPSSGLDVADGGVIQLDEPLSDHHPIWVALKFSVDE